MRLASIALIVAGGMMIYFAMSAAPAAGASGDGGAHLQ